MEKWFIKSFKQRKTNFMGFLRKRISPEQIIQRKKPKKKTQKQSQRMKNNLNRCALAF